jgi:hypothetical protein
MSEPSLDEIVALETEVWEGLVAGTVETEERLLSDDFLGVYPTGFASRAEVVEYITAHGPTVADYSLDEARLLVVTDHDVMLSYRADFTRPGADPSSGRESMYVSSLWSRRDGEWVNTFSQDTPSTGEPVP